MSAPRSLRARLLLAGALGAIAGGVLAATLLGAAFERSAERALDRRLADDIALLAGLAYADPQGRVRLRREPVEERFTRVFSGWYWQIGDGAAALRSRSLWDVALSVPEPTAQPVTGQVTGPRGQPLRFRAQALRLPGTAAATPFLVAADAAPLRAEVGDFRLLAGLAVAALIATMLLILFTQVVWGLRPLRELQRRLGRLRRGEHERFEPAALPAEIAPLAEQINALLDAHARQVARAREAAQDLAHGLKTPLAVLAAAVERPGPDLPAEVAAQVARLRGHIEHHLASSRPVGIGTRTELRPVVDALWAVLRRAHAGRSLMLDVDLPQPCAFAGAREDLEELLGNLLDNACKWARTRIAVSVQRSSGRLRLCIDDDGPGLTEAQAGAVLARGIRLDETAPGSGLGLAIVHRIALGYGGSLALEPAPIGGLRAVLDLPAAPD
ncbi:MAG: sensor histidine kinase [Gammaproteobacteria bacterium]|nr:sensor histidine kinase [Gammaproteobacteria bacterium]